MVTEEQYWAYEHVRRSGATNMFDLTRVEELSGLDRHIILSIHAHYADLKERYGQRGKAAGLPPLAEQ